MCTWRLAGRLCVAEMAGDATHVPLSEPTVNDCLQRQATSEPSLSTLGEREEEFMLLRLLEGNMARVSN